MNIQRKVVFQQELFFIGQVGRTTFLQPLWVIADIEVGYIILQCFQKIKKDFSKRLIKD